MSTLATVEGICIEHETQGVHNLQNTSRGASLKFSVATVDSQLPHISFLIASIIFSPPYLII
jgi:hypothetical protein